MTSVLVRIEGPKYNADFDVDYEKAYTADFATILTGEVSDPSLLVGKWPVGISSGKVSPTELVAAAIVPAPGAAPDEERLRADLRAHLSTFKIPRRFVFITHEQVPRTSTGKVQLFGLRSLVEPRKENA